MFKKNKKTKGTENFSKRSKSKGERLGWVSFENAESTTLEKTLLTGEVINFKSNNRNGLLVP